MTSILNTRILLSAGIIVAVAAALISATGAFFSDTETSTGNTFAAGTLDLSVNGEANWTGTYELLGMMPGDVFSTSTTLAVTADSWIGTAFYADPMPSDTEDLAFAQNIHNRISYWDGSNWVLIPGNTTAPEDVDVVNWGAFTQPAGSVTYYPGLPLLASDDIQLQIQTCFGHWVGNDCDGSGVDNEAQGGSLDMTVKYHAVQYQNNENGGNNPLVGSDWTTIN